MEKYTLFLAISLILSCSKDNVSEPNKPCEIENWGTLCITNKTSNPVKISLNGGYQGIVNSNDETCYTKIPPGYVRVQGEQASGYVLFPDKWDFNEAVLQCKLTRINLNN